MKRILVVEDRFAMLEALRAVVEDSGEAYQVFGVPSAEEGLLEMRRIRFDLLITDVRLPGMSGFELVGKVKDREPHLPIVMITAYASEQGRKVAQGLGVSAYLAKPVDADVVIGAIKQALAGQEATLAEVEQPQQGASRSPEPEAAEPAVTLTPDPIMPAVRQRLETLLRNADARQVMLISRQGQALALAGQPQGLNLPVLARTVAATLGGSFRLSRQLGSQSPSAVHYLSGQQIDLFCANVGRDYCLAVLFTADTRRGRLGTVWMYAQRTIADLQALLDQPAAASPGPAAQSGSPEKKAALPASRREAATTAPETKPAKDKKPATRDVGRAISSPRTPEEDGATIGQQPEGQAQLTGPLEDFLGDDPPDVLIQSDLDAFWESALTDDQVNSLDSGAISFEEAMDRGLISPDFDGEKPADSEAA